MKDPRFEKLAKNLIHHSTKLKKDEKILIEVEDNGFELAEELIKEAYAVGAKPYFYYRNVRMWKSVFSGADQELLADMADNDLHLINKVDARILIQGDNNYSEMASLPIDKHNLVDKHFSRPRLEAILKKKWCYLLYPTYSIAQKANMSMDQFEDFYFDVCTLDYDKMSKAMNPLVELMEKTDKVRIIGTGTDLNFSIKGLPAIKCCGEFNIPDGEVFTAPVKDSINGVISYNTPSELKGFTYENIKLEFENGKIVKATANDTERINKVFDLDEGARYVGEFAIGVNPYILKPMKDTLYDEKIMGSFHFTPGSSYDDCDNGNKSSLHWDLVFIQTPEYGGGEIWFDDVLIRKDGKFILPELEGLNPENLK